MNERGQVPVLPGYGLIQMVLIEGLSGSFYNI